MEPILLRLSELGVNTVVIPASIDNDMPGTEYSIGLDTALNTILEAANKIRDTSISHDKVAFSALRQGKGVSTRCRYRRV